MRATLQRIATLLSFASIAAAALACRVPATAPERRDLHCDNERVQMGERVLVIAPHPDDEVLGFAGVIRAAKAAGVGVRVVIVTDGQGHCDACAFWKAGQPPTGESGDESVTSCTRDELDAFGLARRDESLRALALIGVGRDDVRFLGHDDGALAESWAWPHKAPHPRNCRPEGDPLRASKTGAELLAALGDELSGPSPPTSLFTTHPLDGHTDHATLYRFVRKARELAHHGPADLPLYASVIHGHTVHNCGYPSPPSPLEGCSDVRTQRDFAHVEKLLGELRMARFAPDLAWQPPSDVDYGPPLAFCVDPTMWSGNAPLKRAAIETYATQNGFVTRDGGGPEPHWRGWVDRNGYMLAFVRRTELLYLEP